MSEFEALDFYLMDELLSDEQRLIRDTVRQFVTEKCLPIIEEHQAAGTFPTDLIGPVAELGMLGANLPEEYGCAGLESSTYGIMMQELERGDSGLRSFVSVQGALCMYPIFEFGSEEQRREWLPRMASGEVIGCFGLTEPDAGSDPGAMRTTAVKDGDDWIINGVKMWITNGTMAKIAIIWAQTDDGIRGFVVPTDLPGFQAIEVKGKYSLRASDTAELVLEDVCVPGDALLPKSGGLRSPLMCLNQARYGIAWGGIGAAQACFDEALRYAKARITFGKPVAQTQLVQELLTEIASEITKAQTLCWRLGELKDAGRARPEQISMAKRNNIEMARNTARRCREILGGNGILDEYQAFRHMVNLESVYTYEGTHQIHTLIVGNALTGLPAFG
ncbi:MAG: acyl-CoA dehydrogenase [Acidobacteria bacterium]|nr:acyl-CoA dehydrogenase [Acidobacteriota bacterium]